MAMTPVLHLPLDFERREDVRRFHYAMSMFSGQAIYPFRLWLDWATAETDFRPLKFSFANAESYPWQDDELTFIIEQFCDFEVEKKPGELLKAAIGAGMLRVEERDGQHGLVLNDFWRHNSHLSPAHKTIQQRGAIAQHAKRTIVQVEEAASQQVAIIADRGDQFALPLNARPTTDEVTRSVALIMLIDRACERPLHKPDEYTKNESLMLTALQIVRRYSREDIRSVYEYIIANRDNPRLGKIPNRILERFEEHLRKAKDGVITVG